MRLYKRVAQLSLVRPARGDLVVQDISNAIVIRDLRVVFKIEKDLERTPNNGVITIYNLSAQARSELQRKPLHVFLDAGYESEVRMVFRGDARHVTTQYDGIDWITTIEAGDGERSIKFARVSQSFKAGVSKEDVLKHLASTMGVKWPESASDVTALVDQYVSGMSVDGPSQEQMDKILASAGCSWSIQDGSLQILPAKGVRSNEAAVVSQNEGMIGAPQFNTNVKEGEPPIMTATMLLRPEILPGSKISMQSLNINGLFRVSKITHDGDTHGANWYTMIEATPT